MIMHERILQKVRNLIRFKQYIITLRAYEEMDSDNLSIYDIEHCLLSGKIIEKQWDPKTAESKYLIQGSTISSSEVIIAAKVSVTNKLVIITVFKTRNS